MLNDTYKGSSGAWLPAFRASGSPLEGRVGSFFRRKRTCCPFCGSRIEKAAMGGNQDGQAEGDERCWFMEADLQIQPGPIYGKKRKGGEIINTDTF